MVPLVTGAALVTNVAVRKDLNTPVVMAETISAVVEVSTYGPLEVLYIGMSVVAVAVRASRVLLSDVSLVPVATAAMNFPS